MRLPVLRSVLLNPGIYVGLLATALLSIAAYQVRPSYDIQIGSATDAPLLRGFNTREVISATVPIPFRWSTAESEIILRDVGRQDFDVTLTINGWRPEGPPSSELEVISRGRSLLKTNPAAEFRDYTVRVPRELVQDGTLGLELRTNAFIPTGDPNPRPLGVLLSRVRAETAPNPDRFVEPPIGVIISLLSASLLLGLALAALGWGTGGVALGSALPGVLGGLLLVFDRLWLTSGGWYVSWPQAVLFGCVLLMLMFGLGVLVGRLTGGTWGAWRDRALLTMMLVAFVVRLAGQLHPQIFIVDLGFHEHRFETVQAGNLLFTIRSAEWGGRETFYLPTPYIFMLPLQWLLDDQRLVIRIFTVAISTLGLLPLYYLARRCTGDRPAALAAAALYLTLPMAVLPFSWGITSNLFGEFMALCALALAAGAYAKLSLRRPHFYLLALALMGALLSHPGVVQLTAAAFLFVSIAWLAARRLLPEKRGTLLCLLALFVAGGIAYAIYYSHFAEQMIQTYSEIRAERAAQAGEGFRMRVGGSVGDRSLGLVVSTVESRSEWVLGGLRGVWQEAQAYYRVWPLLGAALGFLLLVPRRDPLRGRIAHPGSRLSLAALGWAGAVIAFALVGWALNLYVRYMLFALPILAIGAGLILARIGKRSGNGALLSLLVIVFFAVEALALWQYRITYAFK